MYNKVSESEGCDYLQILVDETKLNLLLEKKKQFNKLNEITHNHSIIAIN